MSQPWKWTDREEAAFTASKQFASSQVLVHFDPTLELILSCDASAYGVGAVLSHRYPDGSEKPVAFASRTLTSARQGTLRLRKKGWLVCSE